MIENDAIQIVLSSLSSPVRQERIDSLYWLMYRSHPLIAPAVIPLLRDKDAEIRRLAVEVLGENRDRDSVSALRDVLSDRDPRVREAAATALGKLGDHDIVPPLLKLLVLRPNWPLPALLKNKSVFASKPKLLPRPKPSVLLLKNLLASKRPIASLLKSSLVKRNSLASRRKKPKPRRAPKLKPKPSALASLRGGVAETEGDIRPFAVCSDVKVGRRGGADEGEISTIDLTEPATTDAATLVARAAVGRHATPRMDVVFSTYQSIDVIAEAHREGLGEFDLIVCDEAHRTTGVTLSDADESHFVKVHDADFLRGAKRLYMTATPRVFGDEAKRRAADADAVLADMNDQAVYGPELHRLGFGDAVEADLLTDYKVVVLAVDEAYVAENFQQAMATSGEIALGDAAKLLGCWNGLAKHFVDPAEREVDPAPMLRAVAFAKDIRASKQATASFPVLVERAIDGHPDRPEQGGRRGPRVQSRHVDGTMGVQERNKHLAWLKADPEPGTCRVLTNARCLSEGVDVPALDAVMFLTPRGSQVDIVQAVGRVMRKAPGKKLGYIILPVVVPSGVPAAEALNDNKRYQVVWQVLQALRSHDERFHAMINQIELNKQPPDRLIVDDATPRPEIEYAADGASPRGRRASSCCCSSTSPSSATRCMPAWSRRWGSASTGRSGPATSPTSPRLTSSASAD